MRSCPGAEHTHAVTCRYEHEINMHNADIVLDDKAPGQETFCTVIKTQWERGGTERINNLHEQNKCNKYFQGN